MFTPGGSAKTNNILRGVARMRAIARPEHHILSNKGLNKGLFDKYLKLGGLEASDPLNLMSMSAKDHNGRHTIKYWDYVFGKLDLALGSAANTALARKLAVRRTIVTLRRELLVNPGKMYMK